MDFNTDELKEFITATANSIVQSTVNVEREYNTMIPRNKMFKADDFKRYILSSSIEFEISIGIEKIGKGKINLLVADIGGNYKKEFLSKIKFTMNSVGNIASNNFSESLNNLSDKLNRK